MFLGVILKFLAVIFGIAVSIVIHGSWLIIDNKSWWEQFLFLFDLKALNEHLAEAMFLFWLHAPLLVIFTLLCTLIINRVGHPRWFIYSVFGTSFLTFVVLPRLPIFDVLLMGWMNPLRFIEIFVVMFTFLISFFICDGVIRKIAGRKTGLEQ